METLVELVARIRADTAEFEKGLMGAERQTEASSKKMQESLKKIGVVMAASGAAITAAMGLMGKAAIDEEININRLSKSLENVGVNYDSVKDSLEANFAAMQRKTGIADDAQRDALNELILVTGDYDKALRWLPAVLDLAAAKQMDATAAATLLGRAAIEDTSILKRYGIIVKEGASESEILATVMASVGGQAEACANPINILKATIGDISEAIGSFLIPTIKDFVNWTNAVSVGIQNWIKLNPELVEGIVLSTAKLGLLLLTIGSLILIIPKIVGFITMLTGILGPWGWAIIAVTAVVGYLVAELLGLSSVMSGIKSIMADVEKQMFIMRAEQALSVEEWARIREQGYLTEQQFINLAKAMKLTTEELYNQMAASDMLQVSMTAVGDTNLYLRDTTKKASDEVGNLTEKLEDATAAAKIFNWETEGTKQALGRATWQVDGYTYSMQLFSQAEIDAAKASGKKVEMLKTQSDVTKDNTAKTKDYVTSLDNATSASDSVYDSLKRQAQSAKDLNNVLQQIPQFPEPVSYTATGEPIYSYLNAPTWEQEWGQRLGITPGQAGNLHDELLAKGESIVDFAKSIGSFDTGGIVPGAIGQPRLAMVHGGETIIPANESMGNVVINFTQPVFFDREDTMIRFVDMIRKGIQRQDRLRFGGAYSG